MNSTFYQYPREKTVEGWREKAPKDFEFTVKAHQDISHKAKVKVEKASLQAFERMKQITLSIQRLSTMFSKQELWAKTAVLLQ